MQMVISVHVEDECAGRLEEGMHAVGYFRSVSSGSIFVIKENEPNLEFAKSMSNRTRTAACDP